MYSAMKRAVSNNRRRSVPMILALVIFTVLLTMVLRQKRPREPVRNGNAFPAFEYNDTPKEVSRKEFWKVSR
jgi:hypothetical protein